jgi:hypothetical protein
MFLKFNLLGNANNHSPFMVLSNLPMSSCHAGKVRLGISPPSPKRFVEI